MRANFTQAQRQLRELPDKLHPLRKILRLTRESTISSSLTLFLSRPPNPPRAGRSARVRYFPVPRRVVRVRPIGPWARAAPLRGPVERPARRRVRSKKDDGSGFPFGPAAVRGERPW